jgi:hypothetical protein
MTEQESVYKVLSVDITDSDLDYARKQDKWSCAIVRSIQRSMPEATRVTADKESIRLSDEISGYRYEFETPREVVNKVIRRFDRGLPITLRHFELTEAISRWPIIRSTPQQRTARRRNLSPSRRMNPSKRNTPTSENKNVRTYGRFVDQAELQEAINADA